MPSLKRVKPGVLNNVLPEQAIRMVCVKIGHYEPNDRIIEWLRTDLGITTEDKVINYYRHSSLYQSMINGYRDEYESDIVKVELASKRRRMEELSEMFFELKKDRKYEDARKMLAQVRVEREGDHSGDVFQFNQFNALPDSVLAERMKANAEMIEKLKSRQNAIEVKSGS